MKPWIVLSALTVLLVLAGIWLVWSQGPDDIEVPAGLEEENAAVEAVPPQETGPQNTRAPAAAPARPKRTISFPEPEQAPDHTGVIRALEEVAENRQALEDWDKQLAQACKNLVRDKKYEEAQQCYQLRLARNPEDAAAYVERGILHARMGKRVEAYWDYQKYLELEPDGPRAPQIRRILDQYDEWASGTKAPEVKKDDYRLEVIRMAKHLYQEAYIIKNSNPNEALRKLQLALKLLPEDEQVYRNRIDLLTKRIEERGQEGF